MRAKQPRQVNRTVVWLRIIQAESSGQRTVACFPDVKMSFDPVRHELLLLNIRNLCHPNCYVKSIARFLWKWTFRETVNNTLPHERSKTAHASHGNVPGPLPFLVQSKLPDVNLLEPSDGAVTVHGLDVDHLDGLHSR